MGDYRKIWEEANGPIPKGMHIHHIVPRYLGGTDDLDNLQLVTPEEHYDIHLERGEFGACALLSDGIDRDPLTIPVRQYDLDGFFIKEFKSIREAEDFVWSLGIKSRAIQYCCAYKQKSLAGYQWFYRSEVGDVDYIGPVKRRRDCGGGNTSSQPIFNLKKMKAFKSYNEAGVTGSTMNAKWFREIHIPITKEEYYYLKELIKL